MTSQLFVIPPGSNRISTAQSAMGPGRAAPDAIDQDYNFFIAAAVALIITFLFLGQYAR